MSGHTCHIGSIRMTGDEVGIKGIESAYSRVESMITTGVVTPLNLDDCGSFSIGQWVDSGAEKVIVANTRGFNIDQGHIEDMWNTVDTDPAFHINNCEETTLGPGFMIQLSGPNSGGSPWIGGWIEVEDSVRTRMFGWYGANFNHDNDILRLTGTTDETLITGATFKPATGTGTTNHAIVDTSSGTNYAAGNDFGDVSLYAASPAVVGVVVDWPADATYGDNFTH